MTVPAIELHQRIEQLQGKMVQAGLAGALLIQRVDLYYFSGTGQDGYLFIPAGPGDGEPVLAVRKDFERARHESALAQVVPYRGFAGLAAVLHERLPDGAGLGMELDVLPAAIYLHYRKRLAPLEIADISPSIRRIRAVKSPWEINRQKKAALLSEQIFAHAREIIRPGMSELELCSHLEAFARQRGHQGTVRMRRFNQELYFGHIMGGSRAATPSFFDGPTGGPGTNPSFPQGSGFATLKPGEPVLVDLAAVLDGYMVDQTRIFFLGPPPEKLHHAYETSRAIMAELATLGKAGTATELLYERAVEMAEAAGLQDHFMGFGQQARFVGHGVGLELDELPVIARGTGQKLEERMVFALEPKFIFPGLGVSGIEDTFVVRPDRLEQLTSFDTDPVALTLETN